MPNGSLVTKTVKCQETLINILLYLNKLLDAHFILFANDLLMKVNIKHYQYERKISL